MIRTPASHDPAAQRDHIPHALAEHYRAIHADLYDISGALDNLLDKLQSRDPPRPALCGCSTDPPGQCRHWQEAYALFQAVNMATSLTYLLGGLGREG